MKSSVVLLAILIAVLGCVAVSISARAASTDRAAIEALEKRFAAAIEAKDIDAVMAVYLPSDALLVFDVIPPRQYQGWQAYKKDWADVLNGCADAPVMKISDLSIETAGSLGFSHSIQQFSCTERSGNKLAMTLRTTDCYRKIKRKWFIVHEHYSVPADPGTGKADFSSRP